MIRISALVLGALFFAACGGAADEPVAKSGNTVANNRPAVVQPGNAEQPSSAAPPANAANAAENPLTIARNKKIEAMRQSGGDPNAPKPDIEAVLKQSTRPAPENSEFSFALLDILVERRTFLKHPVLAKVEKVTEGQKKTIKVFLKDGRTIDLPGDSIESLSTAASVVILRAAKIDTARPAEPAQAKPNAPVAN